MDKTYKTLLTKAFTLSKSYTGENGDKHWPAKVLDILETKYHLLPKDILRLWYVQRRISAGTLNIDSIYIYDRAMSRKQNIPISVIQKKSNLPKRLKRIWPEEILPSMP